MLIIILFIYQPSLSFDVKKGTELWLKELQKKKLAFNNLFNKTSLLSNIIGTHCMNSTPRYPDTYLQEAA